MNKKQLNRYRKNRQNSLRRYTFRNIMIHASIILFLSIYAISCMSSNAVSNNDCIEYEGVNESYFETIKPYTYEHTEAIKLNEETTAEFYYPEFEYSKDWSAEETYLLAKIAMAEAEGCNTQTKTLVVMCVLNRVFSNQFPNTIEEVIFERTKSGTWQFSPIGNGRWDRVEPNADCYEAVEIVMTSKYDYSDGALYFESCKDEDNWHSRNLEYLYESEGIRFYR